MFNPPPPHVLPLLLPQSGGAHAPLGVHALRGGLCAGGGGGHPERRHPPWPGGHFSSQVNTVPTQAGSLAPLEAFSPLLHTYIRKNLAPKVDLRPCELGHHI